MIKAVLALLALVGLPGIASAQDSQVQRYGEWHLVSTPDSCTLRLLKNNQYLYLISKTTLANDAFAIATPQTAGFPQSTAFTLTLTPDRGAAFGLTVYGTSGDAPRLIAMHDAEDMVARMRSMGSLRGSVDGRQVIDIALPQDSATAYDAFLLCKDSI